MVFIIRIIYIFKFYYLFKIFDFDVIHTTYEIKFIFKAHVINIFILFRQK